MAFFGYLFCLYECCIPRFIVIFICMKYLFPSLHFRSFVLECLIAFLKELGFVFIEPLLYFCFLLHYFLLLTFFLRFIYFYLFTAVLGLICSAQAFSTWGEWGLLSGCRAWASHSSGFSCFGPWAPDAWASVVATHGL